MNCQPGFVTSAGSGILSRPIGQGAFTCSPKGHRAVRAARSHGVSKNIERWNIEHRPRISATAVPVEVSEDTFEAEVLQSDLPVLVDFYAAWCGPCKLVSPLMDWAAAAYEGKVKVVKVDTERNESFVKKYGIYGLPTFAMFVEGDAKGVQEGAMAKPALKDYVQTHAGISTEY